MSDRIDRIDANEIRINFAKLVYAYNKMKLETSEKIRVLETKLKKSSGFVQNLKSCLFSERNTHRQELEYLRCQLDQLRGKMKANKSLYEKQMNDICLNNSSCTCSQNSSTCHSRDTVSVGPSASVAENDCNGCDGNASVQHNSAVVTCNSCTANRAQLEELNLKICDLTEELQERSAALQGCEQLTRVQSKILHRERIVSEEKARDLTILADRLKYCYIELSRAFFKLKSAREQIGWLKTEVTAKTDICQTMMNRLEETEAELADVRLCVSAKSDEITCVREKLCKRDEIIQDNAETRRELEDEIECVKRELSEKNQMINVNVKIKRELEDELIRKGEEFKNVYIDLTCENDKLKLRLKCQEEENGVLSEKLNDSIARAREREHFERKRLEMCAEKLKVSVEEIECLNLESNYIVEKLNCTKQNLENTESNLIEKTLQNEILREKLCCVTSNYQQLEQMNSLLIADNKTQTDILKSDHISLSHEYQKLNDVNKTLCQRLKHLQFELIKSRQREQSPCDQKNNYPETKIDRVQNGSKQSDDCSDETSVANKVHFGMQIDLSPEFRQLIPIPVPVLLPNNRGFKCLDCVPSESSSDSDKSRVCPCNTDKPNSAVDSKSLCDCSSSADSKNSTVRIKMARRKCDIISDNEELNIRLDEQAETIKSCQRELCNVKKNNTDRESEIKKLSEHIERLTSTFKSQEQALRCRKKMLERKVCIKDEQIQSIKNKASKEVRNIKRRLQESHEYYELIKEQLQAYTEKQNDHVQSANAEEALKKKTVASRKIRHTKKTALPSERDNFISWCSNTVKRDERHTGDESKSSQKAHNTDTKVAKTPGLRANSHMEFLNMNDSASNKKPLNAKEEELAYLLVGELERQLNEQICEKRLREEQFRGIRQQT